MDCFHPLTAFVSLLGKVAMFSFKLHFQLLAILSSTKNNRNSIYVILVPYGKLWTKLFHLKFSRTWRVCVENASLKETEARRGNSHCLLSPPQCFSVSEEQKPPMVTLCMATAISKINNKLKIIILLHIFLLIRDQKSLLWIYLILQHDPSNEYDKFFI